MATLKFVRPWLNAKIPYIITVTGEEDNKKEKKTIVRDFIEQVESKTVLSFFELPHVSNDDKDWLTYLDFDNNGARVANSLWKYGVTSDVIGYCEGRSSVGSGRAWLALHELLHAVGLVHEHQRSDQDEYIKVNWDNIDGKQENRNFHILKGSWEGIDVESVNQGLSYDYDSVMHYGSTWEHNDNGEIVLESKTSIEIHHDWGWETMTANDVHAVNRLYLNEVDVQGLLYVYKKDSGYINANLIVSEKKDLNNESWNDHWSKDYTLMDSFTMHGKPHVIIYRGASGYINTNCMNNYGADKELWNDHFSEKYSLMSTFTMHGRPYVILYRGESGYIITCRIEDSGEVNQIWSDHFTEKYSLMDTFEMNGHPYVILYRGESGYIITCRIKDDGAIDQVWSDHFSEDYTLMKTFIMDGKPYVILYRGESGYIITCRIKDDGAIDQVWSDHWTEKYTLMNTFLKNGRPNLVIYRQDSGYIIACDINSGGAINQYWSEHWAKDYTLMCVAGVGGYKGAKLENNVTEKNSLSPGDELKPGESINSTNGKYQFIFQDDGNLVLYERLEGNTLKALWATGTNSTKDDKPIRAVMQTDGNLVLYAKDGKAIWASQTCGKIGSILTVQNDGNVVMVQKKEVWSAKSLCVI